MKKVILLFNLSFLAIFLFLGLSLPVRTLNSSVSSKIYWDKLNNLSIRNIELPSVIETRGAIYTDPDDSTSFNDCHTLTTSYNSYVCSTSSDIDYYKYSLTKSRVVYVDVSSSTPNAVFSISLYKNSTNSLLSNYSSTTNINTTYFQDNLVFLEPNDILYVKIECNTGALYNIKIVDNYNYSGTKLIEDSNEIDTYYSGSKNISFYLDPNIANIIVPHNSISYFSLFQQALQTWNNIANVNLYIGSESSNIKVYGRDLSFFDGTNVGNCIYEIKPSGSLWWKKYDFRATQINILNDLTEVDMSIQSQAQGKSISDAYRTYLLNAMIHEVGHALGLDHIDNCKNVMFKVCTCYDRMGDGDIASVLRIWG